MGSDRPALAEIKSWPTIGEGSEAVAYLGPCGAVYRVGHMDACTLQSRIARLDREGWPSSLIRVYDSWLCGDDTLTGVVVMERGEPVEMPEFLRDFLMEGCWDYAPNLASFLPRLEGEARRMADAFLEAAAALGGGVDMHDENLVRVGGDYRVIDWF